MVHSLLFRWNPLPSVYLPDRQFRHKQYAYSKFVLLVMEVKDRSFLGQREVP
jgi:hypothetical protein